MSKIKRAIYKFVTKYYLKKPELMEFMESRYPSWSSIYKNSVNQLYYLAKLEVAPRITSIQIEITNNCNLKCSTCPVNRGMKRKKGFIDYALFKKIVDENPHIEYYLLFNWGEPLLHPRIIDMINYVREKGSRPILSTNAILLDEKMIDKLLDSGLDRLQISLDGDKESYTAIRGPHYGLVQKRIKKFIEKRNKLGKEYPRVELSIVVLKETEKKLDDFIKKWQHIVDRLQIQPFISFKPKRRVKRCKELWRGNICVLWDGKVVICCVDYEGDVVIGDANKQTLKEIWNGPIIRKLRRNHSKGIFHSVCEKCNEYETEVISPRFE